MFNRKAKEREREEAAARDATYKANIVKLVVESLAHFDKGSEAGRLEAVVSFLTGCKQKEFCRDIPDLPFTRFLLVTEAGKGRREFEAAMRGFPRGSH